MGSVNTVGNEEEDEKDQQAECRLSVLPEPKGEENQNVKGQAYERKRKWVLWEKKSVLEENKQEEY